MYISLYVNKISIKFNYITYKNKRPDLNNRNRILLRYLNSKVS